MRTTQLLTAATLLLITAQPSLAAPTTLTTTDASSLSSSSSTRRHLHAKRAPYATTANELVDGTTGCRAVTVVYARGTGQDGNVGAAGDVGPLFFNALAGIVGASNLAVQGVDYDADVTGFLSHLAGVGDEGVDTMTKLVAQASTQCPKTKIVMAGYSQGSQVVHSAADTLKSNPTATKQVAAVMMFGDPKNGDAVGDIPADKIKIICHSGDLICDGTIIILPPHLNYQQDAPAAAQFIASKVQ